MVIELVPVLGLVLFLGCPSHLAITGQGQRDGDGVGNGAGTGYKAPVSPGHYCMGTVLVMGLVLVVGAHSTW